MSEQLITREERGSQQGATGRIVRIVGPVVDVEVPAGSDAGDLQRPDRRRQDAGWRIHLVLEVESQLPGNLVRAVAMSSTDG